MMSIGSPKNTDNFHSLARLEAVQRILIDTTKSRRAIEASLRPFFERIVSSLPDAADQHTLLLVHEYFCTS
jgi:hypothetical protein